MSGDLILMGRFGAPHGVRGELRLQSYAADPLAIGSYGPLSDKTGARSFSLLSVRPQGKEMLVCKVAGVADRTAAEALTGVELYISREKLPLPDEDEFYLADLVGLGAQTAAGETLGRVVAVRNFGAGDILEVAPVGGGDTVYYPFTRAVVPVVDLAGRRIVVEPPVEVDGEPEESEDTPR